jgi:uncharacterized membrane protein YagU involved in acid resistance
VSRGKQKSAIKGLLSGLVAGAVASAAMDTYWAVAAGIPGDRPEQKPKGPDSGQVKREPSTQIIADQISKLLTGREVPKEDKPIAGIAVHYGTGILYGGLYGLVAARRPRMGLIAGIFYGVAIWLLLDEIALRALDLAPDPEKVPISDHVKALGAHVVYGAATALFSGILLR